MLEVAVPSQGRGNVQILVMRHGHAFHYYFHFKYHSASYFEVIQKGRMLPSARKYLLYFVSLMLANSDIMIMFIIENISKCMILSFTFQQRMLMVDDKEVNNFDTKG